MPGLMTTTPWKRLAEAARMHKVETWEVLRQASFWLAVAGIAAIGLLNVGVSFALALYLALRARSVQGPRRSALRRELWRRVRERPLDFLRAR